MTYVINDDCVTVKNAGCVGVCPVDCIHPTPDEPEFETVEQLYIHPQECIDCGACVEECPVDAILRDDEMPGELDDVIARNAAYFGAVAG